MPITLEEFKSNLTNIVRPNRFMAYVFPPSSMQAEIPFTPEWLAYHTVSAVIPDRTFNEIEVKYYGMSYKIPSSEVIQDLTVTFINTEDWNVKTFFDKWAEKVNNRQTSVKGKVEDLFEGSYVRVDQLDFKDNVIFSYKFEYVFPKTVDQIELSMDTTDSHETFSVTFAYSYVTNLGRGN